MKKLLFGYLSLFSFSFLTAAESAIELSASWHSHLNDNLIKQMKSSFNTDILIETGTLNGECAYNASKYFKEVHTIELAEELFEMARKRVENRSNVYCYLGDSSELLLPILESVDGTVLFWLDAHYSGGNTACGINGDPIIYELNQIGVSKRFKSIILIDDIRGHNIPNITKTITQLDDGFICIILGDILLAFNEKYHSPNISPLVQACTVSRISSNISEIINAEKTIINLRNSSEKSKLTELFKQYKGYYSLWEGLINLGNKNYKLAISNLKSAKSKLNYYSWRIYCYLIQAYNESGNHLEAKATFQLLLPFIANNETAIRMLLGESLFEKYSHFSSLPSNESGFSRD